MSKKFLRTLIALLLVCCMLPVPMAFAESATVTGSDVNMRSGPGTGYPVVNCLPRGTAVTVTDRSNPDWYAVTYDGQSGFMSSRYLEISEESSEAVIVTDGDAGYINAMYVRFRSGPGSSYSILGEYNIGKSLIITGEVSGWTACIIDQQAGYVYSQYVTRGQYSGTVVTQPDPGEDEDPVIVVIGDEQPSPAPTEAPIVVEDPTPAPTEEPVVEPIPTQEPTPEPTPTPTPEPTANPEDPIVIITPPTPSTTPTPTPNAAPEGKEGYIDGDYVRFRSGPGTNYSILDTYNRGKELIITGEENGWTACYIDGQNGYVYSQYVKEKGSETETPDPEPSTEPSPAPTPTPTPAPTTAPETPAEGEPGYITGNNVRFRSGPSNTSEILGEFFYGNAVTITGEVNGWTAVVYNGQSGYVYSQYVARGVYGSGNEDTQDPDIPENPEDPTPSPAPSLSGDTYAKGKQIADYALQFVGYPYVWGGADPSTGFDCSGLVYYVYSQFGYQLNRVAADQARNGVHVDPSQLQPGDVLCFYSSGDYIGHAGIYIGNNQFVHAANSRSGVIITDLSGYYSTRGYEARRIVS